VSRTRGAAAAAALCVVTSACNAAGSSGQTLTGEQVADQLLTALQDTKFYRSATRAKCESVDVNAGSISDCTVWFRKGIYLGDRRREHPVRVTIDDDQGHLSYWVSD
jgi:hypothetical protein